MKTKLIIVRHGQSETNLNKIFTGHFDAPLTDLGKKQAAATAEFLKDIKIDVVYSSSLSRAYNTAKPIADMRSQEVLAKEALKECFFGDWDGRSYARAEKEFPKEFDTFKNNIGFFKAPNGESVEDVLKRAAAATDEIVKKHEGKTVLIATHGLIIKSLFTLWQRKSLSDMQNEPFVTNASASFIEYENGQYKILEKSIDEHLKDIKTPPFKI